MVDGQLLAVAPFAGGLALPVKVGTSGARVRGQSATASSAVLDLGLLGDLGLLAVATAPTLQRLGIDTSEVPRYTPLPRPVTADSRAEVEVDRRVALDAARLGPLVVGAGHETARAPEGGPAVSRTELADLDLDLGLVRIKLAGGVAETSASSTDARGTIAFGEFRIDSAGAPVVLLRGIEWNVVQQLGAEPVASFSLGSAQFAGVPYSTPGVEDLAGLGTQINDLLAPSGLSLQLPTVTADGVTSLRLVLRDSPAAFQYLNPLYSVALAEAVNQAEAALVGGVPETGLAVTVANVLLAAVTGRGGLAIDLGGLAIDVARTPVQSYSYGSLPSAAPAQLSVPPGPQLGSSTNRIPAATAAPAPAPAPAPTDPARPPTAPVADAVATVASVATEDLPAALVLGLGAAAIVAASVADRRRIADWEASP